MAAEICFEDVRGKHLLVALSGGADSVALLSLLAERRAEFSLTLTAAHLHHGIRGAEADGDAAYCRALCEKLGVELIEGRMDIPAIAAERHIGIETAAREERRRFLREAKEKCGAALIALAHHLDDQAETILMHLFRGAGTEGICGMPRLRGELYRPLLEVRRDELRKYLSERGISWREDATNALDDNPRNAIRLNVLPEIEKNYPRCAEAIARHGRIAEIENDCLARMAERFLEEHSEEGPYGRRLRIDPMPEEAILRRCVRRICKDSPGAAKLDEIMLLAGKKRGRLELSGSLTAEKTERWLYFLPKKREKIAAVPLTINGETLLPGICRIWTEEGEFPIDREHGGTEVLDLRALEGAVLRTREEGDRFHPLGAPGDRLLSDCMSDKKIDRPLRDYLPLICAGRRVIWAGGLGIAHEARIQAETRRMVRIHISRFTLDDRTGGTTNEE